MNTLRTGQSNWLLFVVTGTAHGTCQYSLTGEWTKKCGVCVYICLPHTMEYYSAIKMKEIMPFAASWMDLEIITQSKPKTSII